VFRSTHLISCLRHCEEGPSAYHQKRLHFIILPRRHLVDVDDTRVPARLDAAVSFDRLKYFPSVLSVAGIARQPESNEQGLYCFRTDRSMLTWQQQKGMIDQAHRSIYRASYGGDSPGLTSTPSDWNYLHRDRPDAYLAPLMYQSEGACLVSSIPSLGILKCTISGESPL